MKTLIQFLERAKQYKGIEYIHNETGYIAWQLSTGENIEILFIEVIDPRKGYGTELIKQMLQRIKPYNSVFLFRLASNEKAGKFYTKLGFNETLVKRLYTENAVLHVASYEKLCQNLLTK